MDFCIQRVLFCLIRASFWLSLLIALYGDPAAGKSWDRNGAIQAYETATRLNDKLHQAPAETRSTQQYLQVINKYQEVLFKDPHYGRSDDSLLRIGLLYQELAERTGNAGYASSAAKSFLRLSDQYPSSPFRAQSLLAAGQIQLNLLNNRAEAAKQFRTLEALYPDTPQAKIARERLANWNDLKAPVHAQPIDNASTKAISPNLPEPRLARPNSSGRRDLTRILGLKAGIIVIDPGHGGHDTGTQSKSGYKEKDLALDIAIRLKRLIEEELGLKTILTRDSDAFIPLEERSRIANAQRADVFISIHANFSSQSKTSGVETYVLDFARTGGERDLAAKENAASHHTIADLEELVRTIARGEKLQESRELASRIQLKLQSEMKRQNPNVKNRGIKQAPFVVLVGASMPSILTEVAFLSNKRDAEALQQPKNREATAAALLSGIKEYVNSLSMEASSPHRSITK